MRTDDLITRLGAEVTPVRASAALSWMALALGVGIFAAFGVLFVSSHLRADIMAASQTLAFWLKFAFTLAVLLAGLVFMRRLARPEATAGAGLALVFLPFAIMLALAAFELSTADAAMRGRLLFGHSAAKCPFLILAHAAPAFVAFLLVLRRLAPTQLRAAGFVAGLAAGGVGATVYAFSCGESATAFMASWYALGMLLSGALGALLGPRLLRW